MNEEQLQKEYDNYINNKTSIAKIAKKYKTTNEYILKLFEKFLKGTIRIS